jgi:hydroxypyruvate isomerase
VTTPTWSAHVSLLFAEHPYAERVGHARGHGFRWVETWWPVAPADREAFVAGVAEHGMRVGLVNTDGGDLAAGERGFLCDPAQEERAQRAFLDGLELAARVDARSLHVLVGCVPEGLRRDAAFDQAAGMLRELVPEATSRGVAVVVEALNPHDVPGYLTPMPEDVVRLTGDTAGLLLDSYHMLRSGRDPAAEARRFGDAIGHAHVGDNPGRRAPGTGELDLGAFLVALEEVGYDGPIGLEYDAEGDTPSSLPAFPKVDDPA